MSVHLLPLPRREEKSRNEHDRARVLFCVYLQKPDIHYDQRCLYLFQS